MTFGRQFAVVWIALGFAVWASAQEPGAGTPETYFEPVRVPLVDVDVIVTDANGNLVTDLTRDDFEVFEDGEPVEITHFAREISTEDVPSGGETERFHPPSWSMLKQPDEKSYLVLYFDDSNTDHRRRTSVLEYLEVLIGDIQNAGVKTMVVRFDGSLQLLSDFSDPPEKVVETLDALRQRPSVDPSREADQLIREMEAAAKQIPVYMAKRQLPGEADKQSPMVGLISDFGPKIDAYSQANMARNQTSLHALGQLVNVLRGVRGRKAVLWVGNLDTRVGEELQSVWMSLMPGRGGSRAGWAMSSTLRYDLTSDVQELADFASGYMISLYPVSSLGGRAATRASTESSTGLGSGGGTQASASDRWSGSDSRLALSFLTGGHVVRDGHGLESELDRLVTELGSFYSLGYPPKASSEEGFHSIEVKVRRDGVTVRHRHGHQGIGGLARMVDRVAAAAVAGVTDNELGVELETEPQTPREDGTAMVPVVIRIPIGDLALIPGSDRHTAQVSVFSLVRDDRGRLSEVTERTYPLEIPNDQLSTAVGQYAEFVLGLVLRDGRHRVAIGVRDDRSLAASTAFVDVDTESTTVDLSG